MARFLFVRLLRAALTLLISVTLVFVLLRNSGDPAAILLPAETMPEVKAAFREIWGLDQPMWEQYRRFIVAAMRGELGVSFADGRPAAQIVLECLPRTLLLGGAALLIGFVLGIPLGMLAALRHNSWIDRMVMGFAVLGYAIPVFFLGILLILWFALSWRWLPAAGSATWAHLILPAFTLGLPLSGRLARFSRTATLEVLGKPFIRAARAKGLTHLAMLVRHAVPNAAVPVLMYLGIEVGLVLAGGPVTETIFAWPGLGRLLVDSVNYRDLPVVQATILMVALLMVTSNFLADIIHVWIDPRLSFQTKAAVGPR